MTNYYFLAPSLHPLQLGEWPDLSFEELNERLRLNLTPEDYAKTGDIRRLVDFLNVRAIFLKRPLDPRGNLSEKELDDALLTQTELPEYVFTFLKRFETDNERIHNLSYLLAEFFREERARHHGFLHRYFTFEWERRLVLTAYRAKKLKRDLSQELKFEEPTEPFVAEILAQKESEIYVPPKNYVDLIEKMERCGRDPWCHFETFSAWRFERIGALAEGPLFSIDWVLAYLAQHMLVEDGVRLNLSEGEEMLRMIAREGDA